MRIEQHFAMDKSIGRLWDVIEAVVQGDPLPYCNNTDSTPSKTV